LDASTALCFHCFRIYITGCALQAQQGILVLQQDAESCRSRDRRASVSDLGKGVDVMQRLMLTAVVIVAAGWVSTAWADDKNDPTGTWKWTVERNNQKREMTLKLKMEGDTLTGAMVGNNGQETKIEDAKIKDGEISFTVTRERNGQKFSMKYSGKLTGDTIKGKTEFERNGEAQSRDWEAKRAKQA
jgi:hypothetical protein